MRRVEVRVNDRRAGVLIESDAGYEFAYDHEYEGPPVSRTMPVREEPYVFSGFPPFFDGVLPEGAQLEALLRQAKLDRQDLFGQLVTVGQDVVGNVTVFPISGFATTARPNDGR